MIMILFLLLFIIYIHHIGQLNENDILKVVRLFFGTIYGFSVVLIMLTYYGNFIRFFVCGVLLCNNDSFEWFLMIIFMVSNFMFSFYFSLTRKFIKM